MLFVKIQFKFKAVVVTGSAEAVSAGDVSPRSPLLVLYRGRNFGTVSKVSTEVST